MTEYTFCRVCRVPRYVESEPPWKPVEYVTAGWVKESFVRIDASGIFFERTEWLCPDCRQAELADERDREVARQMMIAKSMENDPALYETTMRERAS